MMPTADARKESRLSIPTHMRQAMWAMPAADAERSDQKADMALRAAEASQRRGFQQGAESAHRRALAFCESLPMALRVADSAEAYGFTHLAVDGLSLAVSLAQTMPDVRFVLNLAQQRRYADVVALACSRLVAVARTAEEAVSAAETAYALGQVDIARSALQQALTLVVLPHERRQVDRCAQHLGLAEVVAVAASVA